MQPFLYATLKMSNNRHALVHEVIPYIDVLTDHMDKFVANEELKPIIWAAAARGRKMLDRYYSKTDESKVYRIAMSTCQPKPFDVHLY